MRFGDQKIFQITGEVSEVSETVEFTEDDVKIVSEQSGATIEESRKTLELMDGDLAKAILQLKSKKG